MGCIAAEEAPYGLGLIGAPAANAAGADGRGLVYGSIDTGGDFTHEAIGHRYRGTNADGTFSHDRNWFDFGTGKSAVPVDPDQHGTHTLGTVLGSTDAQTYGVAPKASWISVAGLKVASTSASSRCSSCSHRPSSTARSPYPRLPPMSWA